MLQHHNMEAFPAEGWLDFTFIPCPPLHRCSTSCTLCDDTWICKSPTPQNLVGVKIGPWKENDFMRQLLLLMTLNIAEPLLRSFSEEGGILLPTLVPKMFLESFYLCMEKWQNTIPLLLSFFKFWWQFIMVVFSKNIPSGLSKSLGRKPSSR